MDQAKKMNSQQQTGTIVRVGNQQWVVGESTSAPPQDTRSSDKLITLSTLEENRQLANEYIQAHANKRKSEFRPRFSGRRRSFQLWDKLVLMAQAASRLLRKYWLILGITGRYQTVKESFQGGLIFGLALGCMSLFLFHQVHPNTLQTEVGTQLGATFEPTSSNLSIMVPGVRLYAVNLGQYQNPHDAEAQRQALSKKGVSANVLHLSSYTLVSQVAVSPAGLQSTVDSLRKKGVSASVLPVRTVAKSVPILQTANVKAATETESWLAAETSALTTLTASLSDHGLQADSKTAFDNANHNFPGDTIISQTGLSIQLSELQNDVGHAYQSFSSGRNSSAMQSVLQAYNQLFELSGVQG